MKTRQNALEDAILDQKFKNFLGRSNSSLQDPSHCGEGKPLQHLTLGILHGQNVSVWTLSSVKSSVAYAAYIGCTS